MSDLQKMFVEDAPQQVNELNNADTLSSHVLNLQKLEDEIKNSSISVIPISKQGEVDKGFEKGTPNQRFKTILDRQSRMTELLNGISINMIVHGQTLLAAGDMVDVTIPPLGGNDDDPQEKYYSGKYIIKTLRHTFDQATRTHIASMEVVKDGLPDAI